LPEQDDIRFETQTPAMEHGNKAIIDIQLHGWEKNKKTNMKSVREIPIITHQLHPHPIPSLHRHLPDSKLPKTSRPVHVK